MKDPNYSTLAQRDSEIIWHPYTQHKNMPPPLPIIKGNGALLFDESGNSYIDAISSWWVNIHGHGHPYIAEKIYEQAKQLSHVIFTGFTHRPAVELAERLLPLIPGSLSRIFYSDNGSTAVEVAIKMAIQSWQNHNSDKFNTTGKPLRTKVLAFNHAYHGDTFGAMSISERSLFTRPYQDYLFDVLFMDTPTPDNIEESCHQIELIAEDAACFIYEPLLQGAGGMKMYDASLLDRLISKAKEHQIICIADEVLTGFGRTGTLFASENMINTPDIVCLSKGITGGTMALGATACSQKIFHTFSSDDPSKTFFHGHSFTANPLACAAALASLDLLEMESCKKAINWIEESHRQFSSQLEESIQAKKIKNIRQLGTILAFEIETGKDGYLNQISPIITKKALGKGIYLRPLGNTVYLMPPYCISEGQLNQVYEFLKDMVKEC